MSVKLSSDEDGLMQLEKERLIKRDEEVVEYALESPDGKTAWLFCAIVFLFNFVILGFGYSTAIYLIPISDDLDNGQRGNISLIFGVSSGIVFLVCLLKLSNTFQYNQPKKSQGILYRRLFNRSIWSKVGSIWGVRNSCFGHCPLFFQPKYLATLYLLLPYSWIRFQSLLFTNDQSSWPGYFSI